jgi:putative MATE family efflux protein
MESDLKPSDSFRAPEVSASDILAGPLNPPLLRLSIPMMAGFLFQIGFNYVDSFYVAYLGADALAAVGSIMFVAWALMSLAELVSVGVMSLVARSVGAGRPEEGGAVGLTGAVLSLGLSLLTVAAMWFAAQPLVESFGLDPAPTRLGLQYLRIVILGYPAMVGFLLVESIFRGAGETKTPMIVLAASFVLNIALDRALIFGLGPVPALGVEGAAIATICSRALGCVILVALLLRARSRLGLAWPNSEWLSLERATRIVRIGAPASAAGLAFCAIYLVLLRITSQFGTEAVAALTLGLRLESLPFFACLALGRAAATVAGQCLGAGKLPRARQATRRAELLGLALVTPLGLAMAFLPEYLVRIFIDDPEVIVAASAYLRVLSWCMPLLVGEIVLDNVASGLGDTVPAMGIEIVGTVLRIPIVLILVAGFDLGYMAVWWSVAITVALKSVAFEIWYRSGRWESFATA